MSCKHEDHVLGRLQRGRPHRCPGAVHLGLEHPFVTMIDEAVHVAALTPSRAREWNRNERGQATKTWIEHVALIVHPDGQEHVRERSFTPWPLQEPSRVGDGCCS